MQMWKTATQHLVRFNGWSKGLWAQEIKALFTNCFGDPDALKDMGLDWNSCRSELPKQATVSNSLLKFSLNLASTRAWSMVAHQFPPFCYAGILVADETDKTRSSNLLAQDANCLWKLERVAGLVPAAQELLHDCADLWVPSTRVMVETFARERFAPTCVGGRRCLTTQLLVVPDNKAVEDLHQHMRHAQRRGLRQVITKVGENKWPPLTNQK